MVLGDEELAFRCFCQVMEKFMKNIFDEGFDKLKLHFGSFMKLIEIDLPQLAQHYKVSNSLS